MATENESALGNEPVTRKCNDLNARGAIGQGHKLRTWLRLDTHQVPSEPIPVNLKVVLAPSAPRVSRRRFLSNTLVLGGVTLIYGGIGAAVAKAAKDIIIGDPEERGIQNSINTTQKNLSQAKISVYEARDDDEKVAKQASVKSFQTLFDVQQKNLQDYREYAKLKYGETHWKASFLAASLAGLLIAVGGCGISQEDVVIEL